METPVKPMATYRSKKRGKANQTGVYLPNVARAIRMHKLAQLALEHRSEVNENESIPLSCLDTPRHH